MAGWNIVPQCIFGLDRKTFWRCFLEFSRNVFTQSCPGRKHQYDNWQYGWIFRVSLSTNFSSQRNYRQLFLTPPKKSIKSRLKKKARKGATSWAENCFVSRVNNSSLYWLEKDRAKSAAKNDYDSLQRVDKIKCGYCKVLVLISCIQIIQWMILVSVYHIS